VKSANVTPVHKNDLKEQAENYRPISLLPIGPILGKVLERCRCASDFTIMLDISLQNFKTDFSDNVHVSHMQLLSVLHVIGQSLDKNIQTDIFI
jgi:hypothetical protein